jgi:hypothetical protein
MPEEQKTLDNTPIKAYNIIKGKDKPTQTKQTTKPIKEEHTMKKTELKAIADRYGMGIIRQEITGLGVGLYLVTEEDIPELDTLANKTPFEKFEGIMVTKDYCSCDNTHTYRVYCPANWFDLWGWAD